MNGTVPQTVLSLTHTLDKMEKKAQQRKALKDIRLYTVIETFGNSRGEDWTEVNEMYSEFDLAKAYVDHILKEIEDDEDDAYDYSISIVEYINIEGKWHQAKVVERHDF